MAVVTRWLGVMICLSLLGASLSMQASEAIFQGDVEFPAQWTVFAPLAVADPVLARETLSAIPATITVAGRTLEAQRVSHTSNQFDFKSFFGAASNVPNRVAYVFVPLVSASNQTVTLGMGADDKLQAWLNGELILDTTAKGNRAWPPSIKDFQVSATLNKGPNVLAVRFISGIACSVLALGGPQELRAGDFWSILPDPAVDDDQALACPPALPGKKPPVDIGSRRELFIDDYMVDALTGGAERRLQHPIPREVVFSCDQPWEGKASAWFSVVQENERIRIYYNARPEYPKSGSQTTCLIESTDGIHFTRPLLGLYDFKGSKANNMLWRRGASGHNFTPFLDPNPTAAPDQHFKAIAYYPQGGALGAYASADGIHWRMLVEQPVIGKPGGFDSQNLAFWDAERRHYVCYYRNEDPRGRLRGIWRQVSDDFIHWKDPQPVTYEDNRMEHMYHNAIRPYPRAPHIIIGTPARFVPRRTKVPEHPNPGISDAVLMSSRDGLHFQRWAEGFIRPGPEPEVWTDRNNYPAWGMVQTSPEEISLYWTEHYKHPGMRLRRGTLRTDGFVSVHAGGTPGELLTRPLIFAGAKLTVNYATSATGSLQFELCDRQGEPIKGLTLADSEVLFGNEIEHTVTWKHKSDIGRLAGQPVRLRVRLLDADLYSLRFAP